MGDCERWLLLLHQVPPSPPYLRAKILRRLKQIGAVAIKKSAYVLPDSEDALEDFQWLLKEIRSENGDGWILRMEAVVGLSDASLKESFCELRSADYQELMAEAVAEAVANPESTRRKMKKRYEEIARIDFFDAPGRMEVLNMMDQLEQRLKLGKSGAQSETGFATGFHARRWVTRRGIKIDRTACCWLIRRFIDTAAEFSFVNPDDYAHREGELRFDMFEGEFTHDGELCSVEVLIDRFSLRDPALRAIAEMVHDLDMKDSKYGRPETAGLAAMIDGLAKRYSDDTQRMREGALMFDALYARFSALA